MNSPVYDVIFMQMFQCKDQLGDIKACSFFCESRLLLQMPEQFSPTLEVRDQVKITLCLKAELQPYKERRFQTPFQDFPLSDCMSDFFLRYNFFLGKDLHSIYPLRILFPDLEDFTERSATNQFQKFEVAWC